MMRRLWIAAAVLVPALVAAIPTLFIVAIWTTNGRLAGIATVLLVAALPSVPIFWIWTEDKKPARNMPRRDRQRLRDEERRIRFDAEIERLEREAGIR